ncbi:hypothetical protein [Synechococcus elongatus]|uniref:hypothetical protein n=1 Tax=Synechococcus elongatus TaxID=32046 RepID=UPI0030D0866B
MAKTKHFGARTSQRGIRQTTVELAQRYGVQDGDKFVLNRKQIQSVVNEIDGLRRKLMQAIDKGGIVLVANGETLITAYDFDSYHRRGNY